MSIKKFAFIALAIVMIFVNISPSFALSDSAADLGLESAVTEEKIPCYATLEDEFADDRVLVVLNNAASLSQKTFTAKDFAEIDCKSVSNLNSVTTELANAKLRGEGIPEKYKTRSDTVIFEDFYDVDLKTFNQVLCIELATADKQNVLDVIKILEKHPDVKYAGPDFKISISSTNTTAPIYDPTENWAISAIDLPEAWSIASGTGVVVGVLDSGIDSNHPILQDAMYNGDDFASSYDFCHTSDQYPEPEEYDFSADINGHGTNVAGIIRSVGDDGVNGGNWNVQLVSLRVFDEYGYGYASKLARAISFADEKEIPILNFSGGFYAGNMSVLYDCALVEVIDSYDGLFVCAAGNQGHNNDENMYYPGNYHLDNLITVGACDSDERIPQFSNYGNANVHLFAPGDYVLSCYRSRVCSACNNNSYGMVLLDDGSVHYKPGYHYVTGTSFATPYVTGVAALIKAKYPSLEVEQIVDRIRLGVDVVYIDSQNMYGEYCKWDGRLNAYKALHSHNYTASNYSTTQHKLSCNCGVNKLETHSWEYISTIGPNGKPLIKSQCAACGYIKSGV